jgi:hypothetical protein
MAKASTQISLSARCNWPPGPFYSWSEACFPNHSLLFLMLRLLQLQISFHPEVQFFFVLAVLGFGLRALFLLDKCSTTWGMPWLTSGLDILPIVTPHVFAWGHPPDCMLLPVPPCGWDYRHYLLRLGAVLTNIFPGCIRTVILPISASCIAEITGVSHHSGDCHHFFFCTICTAYL